MKKASLILLCIILFCSVMCLFSCDKPINDNDDVWFRYQLTNDETGYYIEYCNVSDRTLEENSSVDVVIPSEYKGKPVVGITNQAFTNSEIIKSVTLPDTITRIDAGAFVNCTGLESIHITKNVKLVVGSSFSNCTSLKEITVDSENEYFTSADGNLYTADGKKLLLYTPGKTESEFSIPEGVVSVGKHTFQKCESLKSITLPSTVTEMPFDAIVICDNLEEILVDEGNGTYKSIDGNLYTKDGKTLLSICSGKTTVVIPEGVTAIARYAAYCCNNLASVTVAGSVNFIGEGAFTHCDNLAEITFVETTGWSAIPQWGKFQTTKEIDKSELESPTEAMALILEYSNCEWQREE